MYESFSSPVPPEKFSSGLVMVTVAETNIPVFSVEIATTVSVLAASSLATVSRPSAEI